MFTPTAAVFAMWFVAQPFAIQMFREAFASADKRYTSLARTLGLTPLECFFRVELPLARRGIVAGIAMDMGTYGRRVWRDGYGRRYHAAQD